MPIATAPPGPPKDAPGRSVLEAMLRGFRRRCPSCGLAPAFFRYLKVVPQCGSCGAGLGQIRADDAPPYFTILIVGHIVVPGALIWEQQAAPPAWLHVLVWMPLAAALTLALLPMVKGAVLGLMWALGIRGDETYQEPGDGEDASDS